MITRVNLFGRVVGLIDVANRWQSSSRWAWSCVIWMAFTIPHWLITYNFGMKRMRSSMVTVQPHDSILLWLRSCLNVCVVMQPNRFNSRVYLCSFGIRSYRFLWVSIIFQIIHFMLHNRIFGLIAKATGLPIHWSNRHSIATGSLMVSIPKKVL